MFSHNNFQLIKLIKTISHHFPLGLIQIQVRRSRNLTIPKCCDPLVRLIKRHEIIDSSLNLIFEPFGYYI